MTAEIPQERVARMIDFARKRLELPNIVNATYVDSQPLFWRKKIRESLMTELGPNVFYYDFWGWLVSERGQANIKTFAQACEQNQSAVENLSEQLKTRNSNPALTINQRIANRYFLEYATARELEKAGYIIPEILNFPIYDSWSPSVNEKGPFDKLVLSNTNLGYKIPKIAVLDIAAGRGRFSQFLSKSYRVPSGNCLCVDLSSTSSARTTELGFPSLTGDIKETALQQMNESFDLIYLGYCIDRDNRPKETLTRIRSLISPSGTLIFEGLLPVVPEDSLGTIYTAEPDRITTGENLLDDALAIIRFVEDNGESLQLAAFALGPKLVRSLDGPELLSSSTFVFRTC